MEKPTIVFDLDGTLVDTITDIRLAVEAAVDDLDFGPLSDELVQRFVGRGLGNTLRGVLSHFGYSADEAELTQRLKRLMEYYRQNPSAESRPYPGIEELLDQLDNQGYRLGVLSNKEDGLVKSIVVTLFPSVPFVQIRGLRSGFVAKPDKRTLDEFRFSEQSLIYIGDSEVDWQTAQNADVPAILVSWGFRPKDALQALDGSLTVDTIDELEEAIYGIQ
ncbi:MAG: HAD family hydrolase [Sphaerochaeta sp.]|jgi:phosphoglycolate phosphatase|nr:HAD family hydrolase [Spirochaetales bacterium]